ncbi:MAG: hypothetical protein M5R40_20570 [Anaerolineae bacterium]|nr:hypothetical protein [Anaerolineae bacterium]
MRLLFDNLRTAWEQVAANWGVAGVDGVSIIRWGRDWEANLYALRRDVVMNQYRPLPVRRFRIRKPVGGCVSSPSLR